MKFKRSAPARSFSGARVLVTGGASGLGLAMTKILAAEGAKVLVVDVHPQAPEGVLPPGVEYRQMDVRSDEQWEETRNWVTSTWGGLDYLFNNAGVAAGGRIDIESMDNWQWIIDINLLGVVRGCRTFVPLFKEQRSGYIVNTASLAGLVHAPAMSSYNAVKAGVVAVSETLRHELVSDKVSVSVICPAFFRTNLAKSLQGKDVDMEANAVHLIDEAPRSAEQIARVAIDGVRAGKFIILTDPDGHAAYRAKRFARPAYDKAMMYAGKRVASGKPPVPPMLDKLQALTAKR
ncbi:SDR family NAD(P)-dependent oxidoreductase [Calidifontibacter sp. DB0510]|uniref:SDR family NAD(P)-dependent oxidoreductase n=1 Tax=Metallococcus carri TaxID=1656884 RepID=A0A967B1K0_9MICO|nr:SDR family NAD(P)-dependent oxidoreductase [Metallococcus carri]NHN56304.1 SDR family NAD(P)-dependent oxidoreductase [Metallococcus carri]NOP38644.1 SDR family NAD(P)-dependent oxidoreductase [Calidifontibacter sp. DB2511S]